MLVKNHFEGMTTVVTSRPAAAKVSDLSRKILHYFYFDAYTSACIRGTDSPLEEVSPAYYRLGLDEKVTATGKLRAAADELFIRLPRLTALVRSVRNQLRGGSVEQEVLLQALYSAQQLLTLEDHGAEDELMDQIPLAVATTSCHAIEKVREPLRQYLSPKDFEIAANYRLTRMTLLRLCGRLHQCVPSTDTALPLPPFAHIASELRRHGGNALKSCENSSKLRPRQRMGVNVQTSIALWGALSDFPELFAEGESQVAQLRQWLLVNASTALDGYRPGLLSPQDMDEAADVFVGGPLIGVYVDVYQLHG
ncbi:hypothetical protein LTR85_006998 [Meristemomyces frigidus]|nr:hypothetical protein LTR85_006998 [Meristemomyces frigidus]